MEREKLMVLQAEEMSHSFSLLFRLSPYLCHQQEMGSIQLLQVSTSNNVDYILSA